MRATEIIRFRRAELHPRTGRSNYDETVEIPVIITYECTNNHVGPSVIFSYVNMH